MAIVIRHFDGKGALIALRPIGEGDGIAYGVREDIERLLTGREYGTTTSYFTNWCTSKGFERSCAVEGQLVTEDELAQYRKNLGLK